VDYSGKCGLPCAQMQPLAGYRLRSRNVNDPTWMLSFSCTRIGERDLLLPFAGHIVFTTVAGQGWLAGPKPSLDAPPLVASPPAVSWASSTLRLVNVSPRIVGRSRPFPAVCRSLSFEARAVMRRRIGSDKVGKRCRSLNENERRCLLR
jgi:hypothetical protein